MIRPRVFVLVGAMVVLTVVLVGGVGCRPGGELGDLCTGDSDCQVDLVCVAATCVECRIDEDCDPAPQRCTDNKCVPVECLVDADCDPEQTCADGTCVEAEPECTENQDCEDLHGERWECTDGTCVEAESECTENRECENLYGEGWECTDGTCVEAEKAEPTPTPTPLPSAQPVALTDPRNDGRNCETGRSSGALEPWTELIAVEATTNTVSFQLGQLGQFPIAGGMQGHHSGYPLIEVSPWGWFFDTAGHWNVGWACTAPNECEGSVGLVDEGEWTTVPDPQPAVWVEGNWVRMELPWEQIVQALLPYYPFDDPTTITIMFTVTDLNQCDALGEGANGLPTLLLLQFPFSEWP